MIQSALTSLNKSLTSCSVVFEPRPPTNNTLSFSSVRFAFAEGSEIRTVKPKRLLGSDLYPSSTKALSAAPYSDERVSSNSSHELEGSNTYGRIHSDVAESTIICVFSTRPAALEDMTVLCCQHRPREAPLTLPKRLLTPTSSSSRGKLVINNVERQSIVTEISCPSSFRRSLARADDTASTA